VVVRWSRDWPVRPDKRPALADQAALHSFSKKSKFISKNKNIYYDRLFIKFEFLRIIIELYFINKNK
jgi:hypothetical protein